MSQNIGKNLSAKYSQKLFDHTEESVTNVLNIVSKKLIHKTAEETGDLIDNKIADKVTKNSS